MQLNCLLIDCFAKILTCYVHFINTVIYFQMSSIDKYICV